MDKNDKLINKFRFSRLAGVSSAAIYSASKKTLSPAVVGTRININHPIAREYIITHRPDDDSSPIPDALLSGSGNHGSIRGHLAAKNKKKNSLESNSNHINNINNITEYLDLTLRELIEEFGTDVRFIDWLKATKSIEDINEKRLKNAITEGELINIKVVDNFILDPINSMLTKLLGAGAKTLALRIKSKVASGSSEYEIEKFISAHIETYIIPMKIKIKKALKNA